MPIDLPEEYRDLLDANVATLATVEPDGTPQLSELWFLHDEGEIRLSLNTTRRKTQNLSQRPECSLLILDLENPFRYVEIRGGPGRGRRRVVRPQAPRQVRRGRGRLRQARRGARGGHDRADAGPPGRHERLTGLSPRGRTRVCSFAASAPPAGAGRCRGHESRRGRRLPESA